MSRRYFDRKWAQDEWSEADDEILSQMPLYLRREVVKYLDSELFQLVETVPFLKRARVRDSSATRKFLLEALRPVHFDDVGSVLFKEGSSSDAIYIVVAGFAEEYVTELGRRHVLRQLSAGQYCGHYEMLLDGSIDDCQFRVTSVRTVVEDVRLVEVCRDDFEQLVKRYPQVRLSLLPVFSCLALIPCCCMGCIRSMIRLLLNVSPCGTCGYK